MKTGIDFFITGVWFNHNKTGIENITHVLLHENLGNDIRCPGEKKDINYIIDLLKTKTIYTCKWSYEGGAWIAGAPVSTFNCNGKTCLHTVSDTDISNNLENMVNMACITLPEKLKLQQEGIFI